MPSVALADCMREDVYRPRHPVDLIATTAPLGYGRADPAFHRIPGGFWRILRTPDGPATLLVREGSGADRGAFLVRAWGAGAEWAVSSVPALLGAGDDWSALDLRAHPELAEVHRRSPGLRLTSTGLVFASLVAAILEQKTTGLQAHRSWRYLLLRCGAPAPGPAPEGMRVPPSPAEWSMIPSWSWHWAGVEPSQSRAAVQASRVAASVDRLASLPASDPRVSAGLRSIPGVGPWTAAETTQRSHGDPDSVSVGDYHLAAQVGRALIGRPVDDDGMLELLEPWTGHRQRIVRLIGASGFRAPRFGPRITIQDHRNH